MRDKHKKALRIDELNMIVGGHTSEGDPTRLKKIECPLCHTFFDADVKGREEPSDREGRG